MSFKEALKTNSLDRIGAFLDDPNFDIDEALWHVAKHASLHAIAMITDHPCLDTERMVALLLYAVECRRPPEAVYLICGNLDEPLRDLEPLFVAMIHEDVLAFSAIMEFADEDAVANDAAAILQCAIESECPRLIKRVLKDFKHDLVGSYVLCIAIDAQCDTSLYYLLSCPTIPPDTHVPTERDQITDVRVDDEADARADRVHVDVLAALPGALAPLVRFEIYLFVHHTCVPSLQPQFAATVRAALDTVRPLCV